MNEGLLHLWLPSMLELGYQHLRNHHWKDAIRLYSLAMYMEQILYQKLLLSNDEDEFTILSSELYSCLAFALVKEERFQEALVRVGRSRASRRKLALARDRSILGALKASQPSIFEAFQRAAQHYWAELSSRASEQQSQAELFGRTLWKELERGESAQQLDAAMQAIRSLPEGKMFLVEPDDKDITQLVEKELSMVLFVATPFESVALVVGRDTSKSPVFYEPIELGSLSEDDWDRLHSSGDTTDKTHFVQEYFVNPIVQAVGEKNVLFVSCGRLAQLPLQEVFPNKSSVQIGVMDEFETFFFATG